MAATRILYFLLFIITTDYASSQYSPAERVRTPSRGYNPVRLHPCEQSSCYPATGNLLIGRESRLTATSTCGTNGQQRYCIVSHLEERKKCFWCNTSPQTENNPLLNHRIENIVYRNQPGTKRRSWWQSENGKENVTIQLDMEAEFHFTHLIIVFKTFRPAAMLIERSYDFGRTWRVYRYFAHNCDESFPGIPRETYPRKLTDVVCESRYSNVAPSTEGEIIFRVLPPNLPIDDPYSLEVQNLLKMTNLRINFTKLHTLGDDLLDNREEIQEKYYYAISDMVVRGSCSCYGHASRCLPLPGVQAKTDMVHGRCECTHNTKGLNCEVCEDFFNDLPWKPAIGKQTNACRRCTCNNHATSCHYDPAVYEATGGISGGVCDGCQHNTMGKNCEQCRQYYYKDPRQDIQSPDVCQPCDCDPRGSVDSGYCDSYTDVANNLEAGRCHCKENVEGRRCDACKNGYWNFTDSNPVGCQECTCNTLGTINNQGCNVYTGECTCKRYVTGRDCNQCLPEYYGLSDDHDGCRPCDCDLGGSLDNDCDVITGQCRCRANVSGRTCSTPSQHYFIGSLDTLLYEAENARGSSNCQVIIREPYRDGRETTWTGEGFLRALEGSYIEFDIDNIYTSMEYDILIRYEPQIPGQWEDVTVTVIRDYPVDQNGNCSNAIPEDDVKHTSLSQGSRHVKVYPSVCLERGRTYKVRLDFKRHHGATDNPTASIFVDSIVLIPRIEAIPFFKGNPIADNMRQDYERARCDQLYYDVTKPHIPEICDKYRDSIGLYVNNGGLLCECDPTGSLSKICSQYSGTCSCKTNVVGRRCDRCEPATFGFSPTGCKACDCNSIGALNNFCDAETGQCKCGPNTYGRECDQCQPGFWNFPNCQRCECNGHADICDSRTGACIDCRDYTSGHKCEICIEGHYGNPTLGKSIACRPCPCPETVESGHSYANRCSLNPDTEDVVCECQTGYAGSRCEVCADNYYGHPEVQGGICQPCECNNNINIDRPGNCDPRSGKCLKCQYNTEGDHCEVCRDGYYGNATQQECVECVCNVLGTDSAIGNCNSLTGQCSCHRNVIGLSCDVCRLNHWKIASGEGCEACSCDPIGSTREQCNEYDGQCDCKEGFGGRQCNQCQANHWGNPNEECRACKCDLQGSETMQCNRENGTCICIPGIGGEKCDRCARGYLGQAPNCDSCGECFENWDRILLDLNDYTFDVIDEAKKIKTKGATGAYSKQFTNMEMNITEVRNLLKNTTVSTVDVEYLENYIHDLSQKLNSSTLELHEVESSLEETTQKIKLANVELEQLHKAGERLKQSSLDLKNNSTRLQEANVEGALNLTQEAKQRAMLAEDNVKRTQDTITVKVEQQCKRTDHLVSRAGQIHNDTQKENDDQLGDLLKQLFDLSEKVPDLNEKVCDKRGKPCDHICGGAGCGTCGGTGCGNGALTKSGDALYLADDTMENIKKREDNADDILRAISQAKHKTSEAHNKADDAFDTVSTSLDSSEMLLESGTKVLKDLKDILNASHSTPAEIRKLTDSIMNMNIQLEPEEIKDLGDQITNSVNDLTNIDAIINATSTDLIRVEGLKNDARQAKDHAEKVLETATIVVTALDGAKEAQSKANEAINQANNDIEAARTDLKQINIETIDAQTKANETDTNVKGLQNRLGELQKSFSKNIVEAKVIKKEADHVMHAAENALVSATTLRNDYTRRNQTLSEKVEKSKQARDRAHHLLDRATKLTAKTTDKLKKLTSMEDHHSSHTKILQNLTSTVDQLLKQMEDHLKVIHNKSDYYRQCT